MSLDSQVGFVPWRSYSLDDWGPRRRGEWPGPDIPFESPEWRFPEDYPPKEQKPLHKKYWLTISQLQKEVSAIL